METINLVTKKEAVAALNVRPPNPSAYYRFRRKLLEEMRPLAEDELARLRQLEYDAKQIIRGGDGFVLNYLAKVLSVWPLYPGREVGWPLPEKISREEARPFRSAIISSYLRRFVDEWLETGRLPDGSESPKSRKLRFAADANTAAQHYLDHNPRFFNVERNSFKLIVGQTHPWGPADNDFLGPLKQEALRLFVGIVASEWGFCLCKCRYQPCGRYFIHPRPRPVYRRGTFCSPKHLSSAAAVQAIRASRREGFDRLIIAAAEALCELKVRQADWMKDTKLKRHLAAQLCLVIRRKRLLGYREEVKSSWVTRHRLAIEQKRSELVQGRSGGAEATRGRTSR